MKVTRAINLKEVPKAVIFDTDNTLYSYAKPHAMASEEVVRRLQLEFRLTGEEALSLIERGRNEVKKLLGETASSHSRLLYFQRVLEKLNLGSQVLLALELEQIYWRTFLSNASLFDGVIDLLEELRELKIPMAIITDLTAQIQFRKVVYFNLDEFFDYVVTSEEAGMDKPSAKPFKLAMEKMQVSHDDVIWMVGDNSINDIFGARTHMGAVTFQKIHDGVRRGVGKTKADVEFESYNEIVNIVKVLDYPVHAATQLGR